MHNHFQLLANDHEVEFSAAETKQEREWMDFFSRQTVQEGP